MDSSKASPEQLSQYIQAIEKEQKSKIRFRITLIIASVVLFISITITYLFIIPYDIVPSNEYITLDPGIYEFDYIDSIYSIANEKFIVPRSASSGNDTILDPSNFTRTEDGKVIIYTPTPEGFEELSNEQDAPQIPRFGLEIEGYRTVGEELTFYVIGYQNIFTYQIDLGNGNRNIMGKTLNYRYNQPGKYTVQLTASSPSHSPRIFSVPIIISEQGGPSEQVLSPDQQQLASNLTSYSSDNNSEGSIYASRGDKKTLKNYIPPSFPGGQSSLAKFIQQNLVYPSEAIYNNIEGEVVIKFLVQSDGTLSDLEVQKGLGYGCDDEVKRIVEYMPNWIPGSLNGKKIKMPYSLPIRFQL